MNIYIFDFSFFGDYTKIEVTCTASTQYPSVGLSLVSNASYKENIIGTDVGTQTYDITNKYLFVDAGYDYHPTLSKVVLKK